MSTKRISFTKCPPGSAYTAPYEYDVPVALADQYIAGGYAKDSTPVFPKNFPSRKALIDADINSIEEILADEAKVVELLGDEAAAKVFKAAKKD